MLGRNKMVKNFKIKPVETKVIKELIETLHYSHSINGLKLSYCFGLYDDDKLIGGIIYGGLAMRNAYKKYVEKEEDIIELRRLVCIDDTPRNTESYFIGRTLRWLKQNTEIKKVVSYADSYYGHSGIIYKASNFKLIGKTTAGKMIKYNNKLYHDKTIRTTYTNKNGEKKLKPFAERIKNALINNEAEFITTGTKNIYLYSLQE